MRANTALCRLQFCLFTSSDGPLFSLQCLNLIQEVKHETEFIMESWTLLKLNETPGKRIVVVAVTQKSMVIRYPPVSIETASLVLEFLLLLQFAAQLMTN